MFLCFFLKVQKWPRTEMIPGGREVVYIYMQISKRNKLKFEVATIFHLE